MDWCKVRAYAPANTALWNYAEEAWNNRQEYLAEARAISSCWYCQLGMGSGRLSLRDIPEPPDWESTLCEHHAEKLKPVHEDGEDVVCEICGKEYKYRPWNRVMGRQDKRCYCRKCVSKFPTRHLDDDRLVEGEAGVFDHLTNIEKVFGVRDSY